MQLQIINSNSLGNAYILSNDKEALLIECGVRFEKIKQAIGFKISKIKGCILTHEHGDHAKSVADVMKAGINVYSSKGTHEALGTAYNHRAKVVQNGLPFSVGSFKVMPFDVKHDVAQPFGYLINHEECGTVLFLTDSYYSEYYFPGLNNIIVEANYCQKILDHRLTNGENPKFLRDRVITSHMSLETCKGLLQANDLTQVNNIVLIHLSDRNSDADRFKREVAEATGKPVHIALPGLTIPFNKKPF
jgi:phosphoribosyl 1,2-cyclic phosphodiesterase